MTVWVQGQNRKHWVADETLVVVLWLVQGLDIGDVHGDKRPWCTTT